MLVVEDYFEFLAPNHIRIKGHRIGIEHLIELFKAGSSPEEIAGEFSTIRLEDVYATILYYLHNQTEVEDYLARIEVDAQREMAESDAHLSPATQRLRTLWRGEEQVAQP